MISTSQSICVRLEARGYFRHTPKCHVPPIEHRTKENIRQAKKTSDGPEMYNPLKEEADKLQKINFI